MSVVALWREQESLVFASLDYEGPNPVDVWYCVTHGGETFNSPFAVWRYDTTGDGKWERIATLPALPGLP